ncbi:MAG TPA: hypothetical protein VNZ45_02935 [Bacteroidia bacterium]|jgi:hypothetical protein|nr:hypothetical protein [Bacteroidia bacterium]
MKQNKPLPEIVFFSKSVMGAIGSELEKIGFKLLSNDMNGSWIAITYRRENMFIKVQGSVDYRDDLSYYNIVLGSGESENISEWYSIALWQLIRAIEQGSMAKEYVFPTGKDVDKCLKKASLDLLKYGKTFLNGDFTIFNEIVKKQNGGN